MFGGVSTLQELKKEKDLHGHVCIFFPPESVFSIVVVLGNCFASHTLNCKKKNILWSKSN